jgi:hypothetical protein
MVGKWKKKYGSIEELRDEQGDECTHAILDMDSVTFDGDKVAKVMELRPPYIR